MAYDATINGTDLVSTADNTMQANFALLKLKSLYWFVGYPADATSTVGLQFVMPYAGTITKVWLKATTAPVGGTGIVVDININGATIWTNQANRAAITSGGTSGNQTSFDVTSIAATDVITLDIDDVGTTTSGASLTVQLDFTHA